VIFLSRLRDVDSDLCGVGLRCQDGMLISRRVDRGGKRAEKNDDENDEGVPFHVSSRLGKGFSGGILL